jgi:hypothetical protein
MQEILLVLHLERPLLLFRYSQLRHRRLVLENLQKKYLYFHQLHQLNLRYILPQECHRLLVQMSQY